MLPCSTVRSWILLLAFGFRAKGEDNLTNNLSKAIPGTSSIQCFQCFQQLCSSGADSQNCRDNLHVKGYLEDQLGFPEVTCPSDPALWAVPDLDSPFVTTCPELGSQCGAKTLKITVLKYYQTINTTTSNNDIHQPIYPILRPQPSTPSEYRFVFTLHTCIPPKSIGLFCSRQEHLEKTVNKTDTDGSETALLQYNAQLIKKDCSSCGGNLCNRRRHSEQSDSFESNDSSSGSVNSYYIIIATTVCLIMMQYVTLVVLLMQKIN